MFISDTDLKALKLPVQIQHSWLYWKENISTEDIQAALLQGKLDRLMEPVHLIRRSGAQS